MDLEKDEMVEQENVPLIQTEDEDDYLNKYENFKGIDRKLFKID